VTCGARTLTQACLELLAEAEDRVGVAEGLRSGDDCATDTFWGAMRTIVVADAVVGFDNVLGAAGAAHGSFALVVVGLLISVPIVIWGSTFVLKIVERHPSVVHLGAGVLAWTAVKMVTDEPLLQETLPSAHAFTVPLLYAATIVGVCWAGFVCNHRQLESRISARVRSLARRRDAAAAAPGPTQGESAMVKILVPVEVIAGDAISNRERYGLPAGVGAGLMLLLAAED
jgi:predicted tellurium resistance membrane protein TerC